jgi:hypothetical protein
MLMQMLGALQITYKIFCDESNHLYNDKSDLMVIGGICCPSEEVEYINRYIFSFPRSPW